MGWGSKDCPSGSSREKEEMVGAGEQPAGDEV